MDYGVLASRPGAYVGKDGGLSLELSAKLYSRCAAILRTNNYFNKLEIKSMMSHPTIQLKLF